MPTIGSITKTIRISPKDLEVIERIMEDGTTWSGAIHKLCEGVPIESKPISEGVPKEEYERVLKELEERNKVPQDLLDMILWFGVTEEEFYKELHRCITEGYIMWDNGMVTRDKEDFSRFKDACHDKGVPVEKAIEKCVQMILRS